MNRRFTETMFQVWVVAAELCKAVTSASDEPSGFSTTQGMPRLRSLIPKSEIPFWRHDSDAAIEVFLPQHFVDVPISREETILAAERQRAFDLKIADRGQLDLVRMGGLVARERDRMTAFRMLSATDES
jgi:hypothetical protein